MKLLILILACCLCQAALTEPAAKQSDWTAEDVLALKSIMYSFFGEANKERRAPGALRLAFHDCVGGCDGCVNMNNPANFGLEMIIADLNALFDQHIPFPPESKTMSRADFYNLAGIVAIEYSIDFNNNYCPTFPQCEMSQVAIEFLMGRVDCPTSPTTDEDKGFPDASFNHAQLMTFWNDRFGMDPRQVTAILGGHTLGGFHREASGYVGNWKEGGTETFSFNNEFYALLLDPSLTWEHFDAVLDPHPSKKSPLSEKDPSERWQWRGTNQEGVEKTYMADVDVDLILDLDIIDAGGQSRCDFIETPCPYSSTRMFAELYAAEPDTWLNDFVCAFEKMTSAVARSELLRKPSGGPVGTSSKKKAGKAIVCTSLE